AVLAFVRGEGGAVGEAIRQELAEHGVQAETHLQAADNQGAKGWSLPA
ncbi:MAG: hypothetical protein HYS61_02515, partial [Acidobacteria bacterium]|nr:hypothetical protein [Acidobacteriota bacterium]